MSTKPITRPTHNRQWPQPHTRPRRPAEPAWHTFLCDRCTKPFRVQLIARNCPRCAAAAAVCGYAGGEHIGEASGG